MTEAAQITDEKVISGGAPRPDDDKEVASVTAAALPAMAAKSEVVQSSPSVVPYEKAGTIDSGTMHRPEEAYGPQVVHELGSAKPLVTQFSSLPEVSPSHLPEVSTYNDAELQSIEAEMQLLNQRRLRMIEMQRMEAEEQDLHRRHQERLNQLRSRT